MDSKDTQGETKEQLKSINSNNKLRELKSDFFIKILLNLLSRKTLLELIKCNKYMQKMIDININDYKIYHETLSSIELEIIPNKKFACEFINIADEDKKYYHIYFNNNKKEEIKRYELNKDVNVSKINVIIDYPVKSFSKLFEYCTNISIKFNKFYRINITDMNNMFYSCCFLEDLNLTNFITNNVTDMSYMFCGCSKLTELNITNFKTDNVTNMRCMFSGCKDLKELNLTNFNTTNVNVMQSMFCGCESLTELNLANFNTNKVTSMQYMFIKCTSLKELNLTNFNTNNVIIMNYMFSGCNDELKLKIKNQYSNFKDEAFLEYNYN